MDDDFDIFEESGFKKVEQDSMKFMTLKKWIIFNKEFELNIVLVKLFRVILINLYK